MESKPIHSVNRCPSAFWVASISNLEFGFKERKQEGWGRQTEPQLETSDKKKKMESWDRERMGSPEESDHDERGGQRGARRGLVN